MKAYRLVVKEILTSIDRVIPIIACFKIEKHDELTSLIDSIIPNYLKENCVNLSISLRGSLKNMKKPLISAISKHALVDRRCTRILYMESIDDLLLLGYIRD